MRADGEFSGGAFGSEHNLFALSLTLHAIFKSRVQGTGKLLQRHCKQEKRAKKKKREEASERDK
jgi:hypothetical protein